MVFAEYVPPPPSEPRDLLAWWSDVLGIVGFFIAVAGFVIAVFIKREVSRAKREAAAKVLNVVRLRTQWVSNEAQQALRLAREACSMRSWARAEVYFETAITMLERMIRSDDLPTDLREKLNQAIDGARDLSDKVRARITKDGPLTGPSLTLLRDTIATTVHVDAHFTAMLGEGGG